MSTLKRKHQGVSLETKKKIIDASTTKSYGQLAKDFSLSKSTISTICGRDKEKILVAIEDGIGAKRRRLTTGRSGDLEAAVLTWFQQIRSQNVAVTGPLLKVKFVLFFKLTLMFRKKRLNWPKN